MLPKPGKLCGAGGAGLFQLDPLRRIGAASLLITDFAACSGYCIHLPVHSCKKWRSSKRKPRGKATTHISIVMIRLVYRPSPGTKLENLTVGVIQDYMVEAEKRMFAELVRDKRLGQDAYLPKDGSLEYKIMKSGREDLRTLQKIKHNYSWVIGVSKSFNPESCLDHTGKPNSNYIADLPVFQRFIIKPFYECLV